MSGRAGCASSAALRRAVAFDRAGTARRADRRCSPPSHDALGRGQRLHPPVWPLGARTLRRHGSYRPRGGFTTPPGSRGSQLRLSGGIRFFASLRLPYQRGGISNRECRGWPIAAGSASTEREDRRPEAPQPDPAAGGTRGAPRLLRLRPGSLRRDGHPTRRADSSPRPNTLKRPREQVSDEWEGGGEIRPAGGRSRGAGACGPRAARPAGGDAGPDRASHAREGNSEGPHAGLCLLGRTRRRVGAAASMAAASDRS